MSGHREEEFRAAIVEELTGRRGWRLTEPGAYRAELGLDVGELLGFVRETQPEAWDGLVGIHGGAERAGEEFAKRVAKVIEEEGVLGVLRRGVKDRGVYVEVAAFRPNLVESEKSLRKYRANRLTVAKEVVYAVKPGDKGRRLDLTFFVNGIPVATAELKNPLTGQGVEEAKKQYREDRDPSELIFSKRVVANFAVDPDLVFVATRLRGKATRFLPFNTGSAGAGEPGGAGNKPATVAGTYATSYLWEQVWARDNWLELLERFVHQDKDGNIVFPRFHQWDVVKKLTEHAARHGAGHNYLIMASAGSGKSNTIAWLAHKLSGLHTNNWAGGLSAEAVAKGTAPGVPVFDKTIIITDRRNLDAQLRRTVGSFEQTKGLVVPIKESGGAKSAQLAAALSSEAGKIITVTVATFPVLVEYLRENPSEIKGKTFAIVVDEAHSSQAGESAKAVRAALREVGLDADDTDAGATSVDAKLKKSAIERSQAPNLSYFAFTATPKAKTLELFGELTRDNGDEEYVPFHTYSMRQAIEEGFILDPLRNYVTYSTFWKLVNRNPEDREVERSKASSLLAKYVLNHDATVDQQAIVIVEHFLAHTRRKMGGRAKAMVVCASRENAVRMYRAVKEELEIRKAPIGVLVAFSGTVEVDKDEYTEAGLNGIGEDALPKAFAYARADDRNVKAGGSGRPEYRILVVADKYQTGFDEPYLTTMYVNKPLAGIAAVQTLSRLNRTNAHKDQTDLAVLDFINDEGKVQGSFKPYFEQATTLPTDPNLLYSAQSAVMSAHLLYKEEMREFAAALLRADETKVSEQKIHAELYRLLTPAVDRFRELLDSDDEDEVERAEDFRANLAGYVSKYGFLSQIIPYRDIDLEMLYLYGRFLLMRLPHGPNGDVDLGEVDLSHVRTERTGEHDLGLTAEGSVQLKGFGDGSSSGKDEDKTPLSELIAWFNDKYGAEFTDADFIGQIVQAVMADPKIRQAAVANDDPKNFGLKFDRKFEDAMDDNITRIRTIVDRFDGDDPFREAVTKKAREAAWRLIREEEGLDDVA